MLKSIKTCWVIPVWTCSRIKQGTWCASEHSVNEKLAEAWLKTGQLVSHKEGSAPAHGIKLA